MSNKENWKTGTKFLNSNDHTLGSRIEVARGNSNVKPTYENAITYEIIFNVETGKWDSVEKKSEKAI